MPPHPVELALEAPLETASARDRVIGTTELYKNILSFLPILDVLRMKLVNTRTSQLIDTSPALRNRGYFRHSDSSDGHLRWKLNQPIRQTHFIVARPHDRPRPTDNFNTSFDVVEGNPVIILPREPSLDLVGVVTANGGRDMTARIRPVFTDTMIRNARCNQTSFCNNMYLFNPPLFSATIHMRLKIGLIVEVVRRPINAPNGLTLQHVIDSISGDCDRNAIRRNELTIFKSGDLRDYDELNRICLRPLIEYLEKQERKYNAQIEVMDHRLKLLGCVIVTDEDRARVAERQ